MKTVMTEMKNSWDGINVRLNFAEGNISEL